VKLLEQPRDGVTPVIRGINRAKTSIEIVIFRFDRRDVEKALANAVSRGVSVHALIANTNRSGEVSLRKLELRLLAAGVTVARTADDLVRYHDKLMIVDRKELYIMAFNMTYLDIEHSRSFGVVTRNRQLVREAIKLFEADAKRNPYEPGLSSFVVSPLNARKQLSALIKGAKKSLLIYDPEVSDPSIISVLEQRAKAGVEVKILGRLTHQSSALASRRMPHIRLHTRTIIRDGQKAFIGSQSLRKLELEARREVGVIFRDPKVVGRLVTTFQQDWEMPEETKVQSPRVAADPGSKVAKRVAKAVAKDLPPVQPILKSMVEEALGQQADVKLNAKEVETTLKEAVETAVKDVVRDVVAEVVEQHQELSSK
jgi:cardiolipin synthase